jgi:hypothetical protein
MSLHTIITNSPLSREQKDDFLARLDSEGQTSALLAEIKDALQEFIDSGFKDLGVELDQDDPRVKAANAQFDAAVADAQQEFEENMENVTIDAAVLQAKANKAIDTMQINAMKAQMGA